MLLFLCIAKSLYQNTSLLKDSLWSLKQNVWNISESEQGEEAKHKKLDNSKAPEPATPDYAAGLTAVTQPAKVSIPKEPTK